MAAGQDWGGRVRCVRAVSDYLLTGSAPMLHSQEDDEGYIVVTEGDILAALA